MAGNVVLLPAMWNEQVKFKMVDPSKTIKKTTQRVLLRYLFYFIYWWMNAHVEITVYTRAAR